MTTPAKPPTTAQNVINPLLNRDNIKQFSDTDFTVNSRELICINFDDCILILFYNNNIESTNLAKIWVDASSQTPGFIFGAVNLQTEKKIAENFAKLNSDPNHPYNWAALRQTPFILVYRKGWPTAFYNGSRSTQAIIDYTMTLACRADYHEHEQKGWSLKAESNIEISGINRYETQKYGNITVPPRTTSENYTTTQPMRGYSTSLETRVVPATSIDTNYVNTNSNYNNNDFRLSTQPTTQTNPQQKTTNPSIATPIPSQKQQPQKTTTTNPAANPTPIAKPVSNQQPPKK